MKFSMLPLSISVHWSSLFSYAKESFNAITIFHIVRTLHCLHLHFFRLPSHLPTKKMLIFYGIFTVNIMLFVLNTHHNSIFNNRQPMVSSAQLSSGEL